MRLSHGNIGHRDVTFYNANSNLSRLEEETENPRVGGSIRPLATITMKAIKVRSSIYAMEYSREHGIFLGSLRFGSSPARWPCTMPGMDDAYIAPDLCLLFTVAIAPLGVHVGHRSVGVFFAETLRG